MYGKWVTCINVLFCLFSDDEEAGTSKDDGDGKGKDDGNDKEGEETQETQQDVTEGGAEGGDLVEEGDPVGENVNDVEDDDDNDEDDDGDDLDEDEYLESFINKDKPVSNSNRSWVEAGQVGQ